ncbi:MAG: hypothetical protein IJK38_08785 [Oscillospiraceae bacterium]|nr:hypothetical protein [Oscillospiraceae bacterium]
MEDLAEVSMEQEFAEPAAEVAAEVQPEELVPEREETNEEMENVPEVSGEEGLSVEAGGEDSRADFDGNEVPEEGPPEIDTAVYAGWQELAKAHPEVVGKPLPDDIMKACVESGLPPLRVYESMMLKKQGEQIAALQQEIATLKQNAEAAQRAPVTAASLGGSEGNDPDDEFLRGFNS